MKKVVWSTTPVEGGKPVHLTLAQPPRVTGPIGNLAQQDLMSIMGGGDAPKPVADFGRDTVVLAVREPAMARTLAQLQPRVTNSAGTAIASPSNVYDDDLNSYLQFPIKAGETSWLRYEFPAPITAQAFTFATGGPRNPLALFFGDADNTPMLQSSQDGVTFTDIVRIPSSGAAQHTLSFAPVTARFFRLAFTEKAASSNMQGDIDLADFGGAPIPTGPPMRGIAEFQLYTAPRVNRYEEKAGFAALADLYAAATPAVAQNAVIQKSDVVDLTHNMAADGTLTWTPPPGNWTVYRMGYSLTGITNHPAPPEATGPEVDKLDKADVQDYLTHYLDNYKNATAGNMGSAAQPNAISGKKNGLQFIITDSWEAGTQNWTNNMLAEFRTRRGYDATPWLPTLAGRVIESSAQSDHFLWDYRRTIEELLAENHYGTIAAMLHARGLGQYGESHESGRATIGDGMEMKRADDVPMSAMWTQRPGVNEDLPGYNADIRESASVAHIYGRPFVAAESMTASAAPWGWSPATLKPTADKELAMGLNRFVIHSSVHQPLTGPGGAGAGSPAPGLTLGPFGQWFNRNEAWAEQAGPWINYLSRSSYMLQQGRFVADIAYYYGEDSNITAIFADKNPSIPAGYNFDYVNADILEHQLSVDNGDLVTQSGMRYRVLALDPYAAHMSLPVLKRIRDLVQQGATVAGNAPTDDPSLADDPIQFHALVQELWGNSPQASRTVGKGRVLTGASLADAMTPLNLQPDNTYTQTASGKDVLFVHRTMPGADIYFVDNRSPQTIDTTATFRVTGHSAELFHATPAPSRLSPSTSPTDTQRSAAS